MGAEKGAVVITGCSSGVGWTTALLLDSLGYRVFAGVRKEADAQNLRAAASEKLTPVFMDITDHESVAEAASVVRAEVGDAGLAGLVNNAGGGLSGPFEFTPWDEFEHQVRLNFTGHADVIHSFLASVRQGGGRVVSVGSVGAMLPLPFSSAYSSAKAALHAFNGSLRAELARQGIPVVLVVPGAVATRIWDKLESERQRLGALLPEEGVLLYGEMLEEFGKVTAELSQVGVAPASVAKLIAHALSWPTPKDEYRIGRDVPRSPGPPR